MNISRVSKIGFGNIYLDRKIRNTIAKQRPIGNPEEDNKYKNKIESLQKMLNTGNEGNHILYIEKVSTEYFKHELFGYVEVDRNCLKLGYNGKKRKSDVKLGEYNDVYRGLNLLDTIHYLIDRKYLFLSGIEKQMITQKEQKKILKQK